MDSPSQNYWRNRISYPAKSRIPLAGLIFAGAVFSFTSCTLIQSPDLPPVAIALASYSEVGTGIPIRLDGGKSYDPEGESVSCRWQDSITNPESLISDDVETSYSPDHCLTEITPNTEGKYTFQLWVSDGLLENDTPETITISISDATASANPPPVAIAKADHASVFLGQAVVITGEESYDPAGNSLTYLWTEHYQNPVTGLLAPDSITHSISLPQPGGYLFELIVSNGTEWSLPNSVRINVNSRSNQVPLADAGPDTSVGYFDEVILSGSESSDPDNGEDLSFQWTQVEGPPVEITSATDSEELTFRAPDGIMTVIFSLVVDDGEFFSAPDTVTVRVWEHATGGEPDAVWVDRSYPYSDSDGSRARPFRSIQGGIDAAAAYPGPVSDVYIARGSYYEKVTVADGVSLYGGFNPILSWQYNPRAWPTYLNAVENSALEIPLTVENLVYIDGLNIQGLPQTSSYSWGVDCYSSSVIFRSNRIHGGGGEGCSPLACGAIGLRIQSSAPLAVNNIITGGFSPEQNHGVWIFDYFATTRPGVWPFFVHNYINGGGLPDETSNRSAGMHVGTDTRAVLLNNIIDPGLGTVATVDQRYGVYESNGSPSNEGYCPTRECNPTQFHNTFVKNDPDAYLYYDDDGELKDETVTPPTPIRLLEDIDQVNALGDTSPADYSAGNTDDDPLFVSAENGDYHLVFELEDPDDPLLSSPLIDGGIEWKPVIIDQCEQMCMLDSTVSENQCDAYLNEEDYRNLCGAYFPWIAETLAGMDLDFESDPRPNCLRTGTEDCFDIGPDEVYLYY